MSSSSLSFAPFPPEQSMMFTSSYIPIDYNLFQFMYESFLEWIPTQTDKLNVLKSVSNIWMTTDPIILEMLLSYFRDVFHIENAFLYLPSLNLYDQILFQFVSTNRHQFAFWLQNYNKRFISRVEEIVHSENVNPLSSNLLEELIQFFEDVNKKKMDDVKKPEKKRKSCDKEEIDKKPKKAKASEDKDVKEAKKEQKEGKKWVSKTGFRQIKNNFMKLMNEL